jgi:hypothetical protein
VAELTPEKRALYAKINLALLAFIALCCLLVGRGCARDCAAEEAREARAEAARRNAPPPPPGRFDPKTPEDQERCGPRPPLSPFDGEIVGSERFIGRTAHDPDSVDVSNCTNPIFLDGSPQDCWRVTCQVRARNAFGALVTQRFNLRINADGIVSATPQ